MKTNWNDEQLSKALKQMAQVSSAKPAFDQTWFKIEERLEARKKGFFDHLVWKPWSHPVRWVVVTACLCVASTGVIYHQNSVDQSETDSYLMSVANPTEGAAKELGVEKVSVLLTEPSTTVSDAKVDDQLEPIAADEVLL